MMRPLRFRKEILLFPVVAALSLFAGVSVAFAQVPDAVSRWSGNAISGTVVSDVLDGNDGTMIGGVSVASENDSAVLKFNGSSGRVSMGNPANLNFGTAPFSLEALFLWDGKGSAVNNIIRKSDYPRSGPGSGYWLRIGRDTKTLEFSVGATTGPEGQSIMTAPVNSGVFHHVVAVRDSADNLQLYVDGVRSGTILRKASNADSTSKSPFALGAWEDQHSEYFSGSIKEVAVYGAALDAKEAGALYRRSQIVYPVGELGNCKNETECRTYCDDSLHAKECIAFVKKHDLASDEDIAAWEEFVDVVERGGPGDCRSEDACIAYCENITHIAECLAFVEQHDLVSPEDLEEMRRVASAVASGAVFPGGCQNKAACMSYCEDASHAEVCITFAEKAGFLSEEEAEQAKKFMPLIAKGETPGGCTSKEACEAYCTVPSHIEACIAFAEKAGVLEGKELEEAKKVAPFLARGETPGGCTSKEACESYCQEAGHSDECIAFGEKVGIISKEEADIARKTGGKGPGGCMTKEECEAFCRKPGNQQTCLDFLKEHGLEAEAGAEFEEKTAEAMEEIGKCAPLPCGEFLSCLQELQTKFAGEGGGQGQGQGSLPPDVQTKMDSCIAEMQKGAGGGPPTGGGEGHEAVSSSPNRGIGMTLPEECTRRGGNWDGKTCRVPQVEYPPVSPGTYPLPGEYPQVPPGTYPGGESQIPQEYCSSFASVPDCSYVGTPDSDNYKYCKQCYPDR